MKQRFYSLDIFRGAAVALMILVNNPGDWGHIFSPLEHAPWHGWTPTDLVFPFFLFAVGNAMAFVFSGMEERGNKGFMMKVFKRFALIFLIGFFLNWFPFIKWSGDHLAFKYWVSPDNPDQGIRILGVLQRIAICYLFASQIVHYFKIRGAVIWSMILLLGYWAFCIVLGNSNDPFSMQGYFGLNLDKSILGIPHMYKGEGVPFDPEGIASSMAAIVQVIFGYFVGTYILKKGMNYEMLSHLFVAGWLLLFAGYCWNMAFPINKKIWTSSFVVFTTGMAIMILCIFIFLVEFKNKRGVWNSFFNAFGKNPLFIFILSGMIPRLSGLIRWQNGADSQGALLYQTPLSWFFEHLCKPVAADLRIGSLVYALLTVCFYWLIAYWLDKKKIYVKV